MGSGLEGARLATPLDARASLGAQRGAACARRALQPQLVRTLGAPAGEHEVARRVAPERLEPRLAPVRLGLKRGLVRLRLRARARLG